MKTSLSPELLEGATHFDTSIESRYVIYINIYYKEHNKLWIFDFGQKVKSISYILEFDGHTSRPSSEYHADKAFLQEYFSGMWEKKK